MKRKQPDDGNLSQYLASTPSKKQRQNPAAIEAKISSHSQSGDSAQEMQERPSQVVEERRSEFANQVIKSLDGSFNGTIDFNNRYQEGAMTGKDMEHILEALKRKREENNETFSNVTLSFSNSVFCDADPLKVLAKFIADEHALEKKRAHYQFTINRLDFSKAKGCQMIDEDGRSPHKVELSYLIPILSLLAKGIYPPDFSLTFDGVVNINNQFLFGVLNIFRESEDIDRPEGLELHFNHTSLTQEVFNLCSSKFHYLPKGTKLFLDGALRGVEMRENNAQTFAETLAKGDYPENFSISVGNNGKIGDALLHAVCESFQENDLTRAASLSAGLALSFWETSVQGETIEMLFKTLENFPINFSIELSEYVESESSSTALEVKAFQILANKIRKGEYPKGLNIKIMNLGITNKHFKKFSEEFLKKEKGDELEKLPNNLHLSLKDTGIDNDAIQYLCSILKSEHYPNGFQLDLITGDYLKGITDDALKPIAKIVSQKEPHKRLSLSFKEEMTLDMLNSDEKEALDFKQKNKWATLIFKMLENEKYRKVLSKLLKDEGFEGGKIFSKDLEEVCLAFLIKQPTEEERKEISRLSLFQSSEAVAERSSEKAIQEEKEKEAESTIPSIAPSTP